MTYSESVQALFQSFAIGTLSLPNRIVMAPMTRQFSPEGVPTADVAAYYRRRAENSVGLIVTEGTIIDHPDSSNQPNVPHFYGETALNGWANVLAEVHEAGGRIFPQIWHMGVRGQVGDYSEADIASIVQAFAQSAAEAKRLGFDGIELHGAHGYLIDQFFWEKTNPRTDRYGGDMVKRTRFAVEVIEACRRAVGSDFPIVLRISQWKSTDYTAKLATTPAELEQFLKPLTAAGVDVFHCSTRRFWEPEFEGSELNLAGWVKKLTGKPTITVGSVGLDTEFMSYFTEGKGSNHTKIDSVMAVFLCQESTNTYKIDNFLEGNYTTTNSINYDPLGLDGERGHHVNKRTAEVMNMEMSTDKAVCPLCTKKVVLSDVAKNG